MSITAHRRSAPKVETATAEKMGPWQATALVVGSIVGVGIFSLPYSLASYGPISLVAMAIASIGAIALAMVFSGLSRRLPASGGPYAYARTAFGNTWGFVNAWSYWITAWAGNAAIAVGWVYYVEHFVNKGGNTTASIFIVLAGLWIPAAVNLTGVRNLSAFQVVTTVFKFVPLIFMATVGLFFISTANFTPWNTSGDTTSSAIGGAAAICLFSFLGVEVAAVAAA
ncbi:MAG TPA: amino acid permease, partial [Acidimicrobiales bacterium]